MLVLESKLDICRLSTIGIMRQQSKFSRSYPIIPYSFIYIHIYIYNNIIIIIIYTHIYILYNIALYLAFR